MRLLLALVILVLLSVSAAAQEQRTFAWTPATGPVATYDVWVSRGGSVFLLEQSVPFDSLQAVIDRAPTETIVVKVQARSIDGRAGPTSVASDPLNDPQNVGPLGTPGQPSLSP